MRSRAVHAKAVKDKSLDGDEPESRARSDDGECGEEFGPISPSEDAHRHEDRKGQRGDGDGTNAGETAGKYAVAAAVTATSGI
jgi:hypothetical protein